MMGQVTGNKRECIYSPLQWRVRSRSELQKSLSLGNESNTWYTQQRTPPKEKQDGMKRKLPALYSGTNDISTSWLMPVEFKYKQTEVKRFFSWLSILSYMTNKVIKDIQLFCCSRHEPFPCCANFGLYPWLLWSDLARGLTFLNSYPSYSGRSHLNTDFLWPKRINSIAEWYIVFLRVYSYCWL